MDQYPFENVENKWRSYWEKTKLHETDLTDIKNKLYVLVMFIYPSGDRLHIGHWYNYGPTDTWARFKRMQGYHVFEPIGYDAFGLPAENYAIKQGIHPAESTNENIKNIREQLKVVGAMYDWSKEINTSSPIYYKWTQWLFLQLYKNGLAYRQKAPVNWCPGCHTVLANEQVVEGQCERCDSEIIQRDLKQWFFKITDYAEKLLEGYKYINWPEKTVTMQKNWIGRSEGALITFTIPDYDINFDVFTTRPDTLFGVTYMVFAPEHPLVPRITIENKREEVNQYIEQSKKKTEIERTSVVREKTGVFTGAYAVNPVNNEKVPIWIADYVLLRYGTGAVMAVPAHDQRDFEFASKFDLEIRPVISPTKNEEDVEIEQAFTEQGIMIHSGQFTGLPSEEGMHKITQHLEQNGLGKYHVTYKIRDWLISRQRYWGAPIPIVYCDQCGEVPVDESDLPVKLPDDVTFTGKGESPLSTSSSFVNATCPNCQGPATREVDTMDTFVCSAWYFLRYMNPHDDTKPWDRELADQWLPVDQYVGGAEHAVLHLLYARFITKVLYDLKYIGFDEPFKNLFHQGTITNKGAKMSKSRGNIVNPDEFIGEYGSDTFRMYLMFMGSYEDGGDWSDEGITGIHRFINRVWRLVNNFVSNKPNGNENKKSPEIERIQHHTIKEVSKDLERFQFNTAISRLMEFYNAISDYQSQIQWENQNRTVLENALNTFVLLLAPFAPHFGEELWHILGNKPSIFDHRWPEYKEEMLKKEEMNIVVQINGKLRDQITTNIDTPEDEVIQQALQSEKIKKYTQGRKIIKKIYIPNKLVNLVVK